MEAELVFYNNAKLLEGPCWDRIHQLLYFVAIRQNTIFAFNAENGRVICYETEGPVGCAVVTGDGTLLEAEKRGIFTINPQTGEKAPFAHIIRRPNMRYNDGKLDPRGRFLVGVMGDEERLEGMGGLYAVEYGEGRLLIGGTTVANGLGFSARGDTLYFIDTPTKTVCAYEYESETGTAAGGRVCIALTGEGKPDGMCVDIDDMLWVAEWGGGRVRKWDPQTGVCLCAVTLPCKNVTSCCIGGRDMEYLYITTAKTPDVDEPLAGGLFRVRLR